MSDPTLFKPGPALGNMDAKEEAMLQLLQARPSGVRSSDVGVHIHMTLGVPCACSESTICRWAFSDAERVGRKLRARDLAIKRRTGLWQALVPAQRDTGTFPTDF